MRTFCRTLVIYSLLIAALDAVGSADFPNHTGYVNDFANLLSSDRRGELEQLLRETERQTKSEVVLATVPSLDGMSVEEYANRLFNEWGIGKDAVDNGVLILVAPAQREMRIEVGYGLEPVLPDGLAGQIIRESFIPRFRADDYPGGIDAGVRRVVEVVKRNHVLTADELEAIEEAARNKAPWYITVPFFSVFVGIGFYMLGAGIGSKTGFPVLFGSFFGGMPLLMTLIPDLRAPTWVLGSVGAFCFLLGFRSGRNGTSWVSGMRAASKGGKQGGWVMGPRGRSRSRSGGWSSGSSSSDSSSSSSSSSSFGGGSSGGGGASGKW